MNYLRSDLSVKTFSLFLLLIAAAVTVRAGGGLDPTFSGNGKLVTDFDLGEDQATCVAVQPDGKIVVAGSGDGLIKVARYNANGSLDTSFSGDGKATLAVEGAFISAVIIQANGRIVVAGSTSNQFGAGGMIARFTSIGIADPTFGTNGVIKPGFGSGNSTISDIAIQNDGKIVALGLSSFMGITTTPYLLRFNSNGSADNTFNQTGQTVVDFGPSQRTSVSAVEIFSNGKILAAGSAAPNVTGDFALALYNPNGSIDTTFGSAGHTVTDFNGQEDRIIDVKLQVDGKIVAAGFATLANHADFAVARFNADGTLDGTFSGDGRVETDMSQFGDDQVNSIAIQPNGKIIAAGNAGAVDFALAAYTREGGIDNNFGTAGRVYTDIAANSSDVARGMVIQADTRLVVAGQSQGGSGTVNFAVARYQPALGSTPYDYDHDGASDYSVFRPSTNAWYVMRSRDGLYGINFGLSTDKLTPADYDGDGKTDIAVYRPSTGIWYIFKSSTGTVSYAVFGIGEDLPAPADYDGDEHADICVFRPSTGIWYRQNSRDGSFFALQFGTTSDKPTVGDFDGDGMADIAVVRPSTATWYRVNSSTGTLSGDQFGVSSDIFVQADYNGDGRTDNAVYRPSNRVWYIRTANEPYFNAIPFGVGADVPVPADFNGDGSADLAIFRPSMNAWYWQSISTTAHSTFPFGASGDIPIQSVFRY